MSANLIWAAAAGIVGVSIALRVLYWYFNATVCIECYKKIRVREASPVRYRNKDMYLCKECNE